MKNPVASILKTVSYIIGILGILVFFVAISTGESVLAWITLASSLSSALIFYTFSEIVSLLQKILDKMGGGEPVDEAGDQVEELDDSIPSI